MHKRGTNLEEKGVCWCCGGEQFVDADFQQTACPACKKSGKKGKPATPEQLAILAGVVGLELAKAGFSFDEMQLMLGNKSGIQKRVIHALRTGLQVFEKPKALLDSYKFKYPLSNSLSRHLDDFFRRSIMTPQERKDISRIERVAVLERLFLIALCEDPRDGTVFDNDVLDALRDLKARVVEIGLDPRLVHEQQFWAKLGVAVAIDDLVVPELPADFTEVAIIPEHLSTEQLFALCKKHFPSWKYYNDLDQVALAQVRPTGTYVIGYRGGVEPDALHLGKSYEVAVSEELMFMNPKERLVAELRCAVPDGVYLNRHLDVKGVSILSSLAPDGRAFYPDWNPSCGGFRVGGCDRSCADPGRGPREVVFA